MHGPKGPHLVIPYTLDANDMRFATPQGFNSGDQFFAYLKDSFDVLYREGGGGRAKMFNIGLHCRLVGRPGRSAALERFVDYVLSHDKVWVTRRIDIARHWREVHPARVGGKINSQYAHFANEIIREDRCEIRKTTSCSCMMTLPYTARKLGSLTSSHSSIAAYSRVAARLATAFASEERRAGSVVQAPERIYPPRSGLD